MLKIDFVSIQPDFVQRYFTFGVFEAAKRKNLCQVNVINLREFAIDQHGSIDDRPYGGGDSMVMRPEPLAAAVKSIAGPTKVIYTSPHGRPFNHHEALTLSKTSERLVMICGRFAGVDQRFLDRYVDDTFSLGEFVLSGGELAALSIADACLRLVPGVLGNPQSCENDSFSERYQGKLEYPLYTRPPQFEGIDVPAVLLSGDHRAIERWRQQQIGPTP